MSKKKLGRPIEFTEDKKALVLAKIEAGETLRKIQSHPDLPSRETILKHARTDPDFRERYTIARMLQADLEVDEIIDIADFTDNDLICSDDTTRPNTAAVQRDRLRIDARMFRAKLMAPHKYNQERFGIRQKIEELMDKTASWEERSEKVFMLSAAGQISPDEANKYIAMLTNIANLVEKTDTQKRLDVIEEKFK